MHYKYFFFDFDGMLADTYPHTTQAFVDAMWKCRKQKIIFKEAYDLFKESFGVAYKHYKVTPEEDIIFTAYQEDFNRKPVPTLYLPIINILQSIIDSGGKNFIYTNRGDSLFNFIDKLGIRKYFTDFFTETNKPNPQALLDGINKHHLQKDLCVVVGDRSLDVDAAYNANVAGILYDEDSRVFMHHATYVIKRINELYNFIDLPYHLLNNYHTHTARCGHAFGTDEQYVIEAIKAGFQTLGFSDHFMVPDIQRNYEYFESIALLKEKYKNQIDIKIALEVEYYEYYLPFYKKILAEKQVDYLIFGNHFYVDPKNKDRTNAISFLDDIDCKEKLDLYYQTMEKAVETGLFKYIAHPDVFMKSYQKWDEYTISLSHKIAALLEKYNLYAELNGQGYRSRKRMIYQGKEIPTYPFAEFFKILSQYNIRFVIGCDAHSPNGFNDESVKFMQDMARKLKLNVVYTLDDL